MSAVKLSIIYYSRTGTVRSMAEHLYKAAEDQGAEARLRPVTEAASGGWLESNESFRPQEDRTPGGHHAATAADITWADVVLFGTPTRFGNVAGQFKQFLDTLGPQWAAGELADKVYAGFVATQTPHGGQESTLLALYNSIHHFGGVVVSPGYTDSVKFADGNPYGVGHVTGPDNDNPLGSTETDALDHLVSRAISVAARLKNIPPSL
ncbi:MULTISPECIES: flavodoxin family protein [Amycolatopsis]|uniref:NAD(P)H dehydrogenase (Quinone) n=1 Tax=Amycolatopsis echigonensis TaxID=2576905 RepID=A0A2N3WNR6_9PSEU|nr:MULTISPECIES: flavodoxin family protein [Amycolatopsis]PKV95504.1 NAD(P)H dehydrogenase (quinone) [Amycolatopsis niigatensis]